MSEIMRFNTQPPEGGWKGFRRPLFCSSCFNTQPPEGGWLFGDIANPLIRVSTHSRLKAAGSAGKAAVPRRLAFQHTAA